MNLNIMFWREERRRGEKAKGKMNEKEEDKDRKQKEKKCAEELMMEGRSRVK